MANYENVKKVRGTQASTEGLKMCHWHITIISHKLNTQLRVAFWLLQNLRWHQHITVY